MIARAIQGIARRLPAALLLAALAVPPARAQPIDLSSGGPVEVTAVNGFEWNEDASTVTASGAARAVRGDVTVLADQLVAHYRKKAGDTQPAAANSGSADTGSNEIYRLDAVGHVRIVTATDEAVGDKAVYDIDQSVLVMTGSNLRLSTPQYVLTARDDLEYWAQQRMAIGRGNAVVVASDGRRLAADVLVAYISQGAAHTAAASSASSTATTGKLERVEAFGNVDVRTQTDDVRGDRGVYLPDSGMARLLGNVKVVHGQNVITGAAADLNMTTGIAHVISNPSGRVEGLIMPNDATTGTTAGPPPPARTAR